MFFVIREVIKKTPNALTFLYSILLGAFGIVYDILVGLTILNPPEIAPFTGIIFIFIQSHIVASNFGEDFQKVEKLTNQLNEEVDRKTGQIKDQNKRKMLGKNAKYRAQSELDWKHQIETYISIINNFNY